MFTPPNMVHNIGFDPHLKLSSANSALSGPTATTKQDSTDLKRTSHPKMAREVKYMKQFLLR